MYNVSKFNYNEEQELRGRTTDEIREQIGKGRKLAVHSDGRFYTMNSFHAGLRQVFSGFLGLRNNADSARLTYMISLLDQSSQEAILGETPGKFGRLPDYDGGAYLAAHKERILQRGSKKSEALFQQITAAAAKSAESKDRINALEGRLKECEPQSALSSDPAVEDNGTEVLQGQITELTSQMEAATSRHEKEATALRARIEELEALPAPSSTDETKPLKTEISSLKKQLSASEQAGAEASETFHAKKAELEASIQSLEEKLETASSENSGLKRAAAKAAEVARETIAGLQKQLESQAKTMEELASSVKELTGSNSELEIALEKAKASVDSLSTENSTLRDQVSHLSQQADELKSAAAEANTEISHTKAELQLLAESSKSTESKVTELEAAKATLEEQLRAAEEKLVAAEELRFSLREKLEAIAIQAEESKAAASAELLEKARQISELQEQLLKPVLVAAGDNNGGFEDQLLASAGRGPQAAGLGVQNILYVNMAPPPSLPEGLELQKAKQGCALWEALLEAGSLQNKRGWFARKLGSSLPPMPKGEMGKAAKEKLASLDVTWYEKGGRWAVANGGKAGAYLTTAAVESMAVSGTFSTLSTLSQTGVPTTVDAAMNFAGTVLSSTYQAPMNVVSAVAGVFQSGAGMVYACGGVFVSPAQHLAASIYGEYGTVVQVAALGGTATAGFMTLVGSSLAMQFFGSAAYLGKPVGWIASAAHYLPGKAASATGEALTTDMEELRNEAGQALGSELKGLRQYLKFVLRYDSDHVLYQDKEQFLEGLEALEERARLEGLTGYSSECEKLKNFLLGLEEGSGGTHKGDISQEVADSLPSRIAEKHTVRAPLLDGAVPLVRQVLEASNQPRVIEVDSAE